MKFKIVEKKNRLAVHGIFDSRERAEKNLREVKPGECARELFMDKTLKPEDFEIIPMSKPKVSCQCSDPGCPVHAGKSSCTHRAITALVRVDMEDITGTAFCRACADDAFESGLFRESIKAKIAQGL
jgi:hypothetical protein